MHGSSLKHAGSIEIHLFSLQSENSHWKQKKKKKGKRKNYSLGNAEKGSEAKMAEVIVFPTFSQFIVV